MLPAVFVLFAASTATAPPDDVKLSALPEVHAVKISTPDLSVAEEFYVQYLGFDLAEEEDEGDCLVLLNDSVRLILCEDPDASTQREASPRMTINFHVRDVEALLREWKDQGGPEVDGPAKRISIGRSARFYDPFGVAHNVMTIDGRSSSDVPRVFNVSVNVQDIDSALRVYVQGLGFDIFSLRYFPPTLPLNRRGVVPLVVHVKEGLSSSASRMGLVFETADLQVTLNAVHAQGARRAAGSDTSFVDLEGLSHEVRAPR